MLRFLYSFKGRQQNKKKGRSDCGDLAGVLSRRWASVFGNTSVSVGRELGGGWADCDGTCSSSSQPWTHAALKDLLGPRVAMTVFRDTGGFVQRLNNQMDSLKSDFFFFFFLNLHFLSLSVSINATHGLQPQPGVQATVCVGERHG